jgi:hypothetical protein
MASSTTRVDETAAAASSEVRPVRKRRRVILRILLLIVIALIAYTAFDLLGPRSSRMVDRSPRARQTPVQRFSARARLVAIRALPDACRAIH